MQLEEIIEFTEKCLIIDETNLAKEALETPKIYGRVLRIRTEESMRLKKITMLLKRMLQEKRDYYLGRSHPDVYKEKPFDLKILKSEVDRYIEADDEVQELILKGEIQQEKIDYLDSALKQIGNRGFLIKSAIDFQKLMSGGY